MLRPPILCLAAFLGLVACARAESKRDTLSDCFFIQHQGFFGKGADLFAHRSDGSARKIGWLGFYGPYWDTPHRGTETQFAVSHDGRSIVFRNRWPFGKGTDRVEAGVHRYSCGGRDTLLHSDQGLVAEYQTSHKAFPRDVMMFAFWDSVRGPASRVWAVRAEGGEVPLVLLDASPLHAAAFYGRSAEIDSLLDHGVDPATPNLLDMSALDVALYTGQEVAALRLIHGAGADSALLKRAMAWAIPLGRWKAVAEMIDGGVDPDAAYDRWSTPLLGSLETPSRPQFEQELCQLAFVPNSIKPLKTPASIPEGVRLLLDRGADPNGIGPGGLTPLQKIARMPSAGAVEAAHALIARGADLALTDGKGNTPLHTLVGRYGYSSDAWKPEAWQTYQEGPFRALLELYVANTKHLDRRDPAGRTPVERAIGAGNFIAAHYLVEHGATDTTVFYGHTIRKILADELKNRRGSKWWAFRRDFAERYGVPADANRE